MGLCVLCTVYVSDLSVSLVCSITYCTLDGLDIKDSLILKLHYRNLIKTKHRPIYNTTKNQLRANYEPKEAQIRLNCDQTKT